MSSPKGKLNNQSIIQRLESLSNEHPGKNTTKPQKPKMPINTAWKIQEPKSILTDRYQNFHPSIMKWIFPLWRGVGREGIERIYIRDGGGTTIYWIRLTGWLYVYNYKREKETRAVRVHLEIFQWVYKEN